MLKKVNAISAIIIIAIVLVFFSKPFPKLIAPTNTNKGTAALIP